MTVVSALMLAQAVPNVSVVPEPNEELDVANACLVKATDNWIERHSGDPSPAERWKGAVSIAGACAVELNAAADSAEAKGVEGQINHVGLSQRQQIRVEANYYVDQLIREHFEAQS